MADRIVEDTLESIPEIPERLQAVLIASLKEARERLEKGESVVPFTALAVKENLFLESHPADDTQQCFNLARHTVQNVRGADAYALCYDGYVETDDGTKDALIAEGGIAGEPEGYAIGYLYEEAKEEGAFPKVTSQPVYIGPAPNFMMLTPDVPAEPATEAEAVGAETGQESAGAAE